MKIISLFSYHAELPGGLPVTYCKDKPSSCMSIVNLKKLEILMQNRQAKNTLLSTLSSQEQEVLKTFSRPKRIREWLGGRLAAKISLLKLENNSATLNSSDLAQYIILPDSDFRPTLILPKSSEFTPSISISHSANHAVAIAQTSASCGIDLQQITDRIRKVQKRFASVSEVELLHNHFENSHDLVTSLTMLWAAKEAFKKGIIHNQPPGFTGIRLIKIEKGTYMYFQLTYKGSQDLAGCVKVIVSSGYALAFTLVENEDA